MENPVSIQPVQTDKADSLKKEIEERNKKKELFLAKLKDENIRGNITLASKLLVIGRATIYEWMNNDPTFATAVDDAVNDGREVAADLAEAALLDNALVGKDTTAQIFLLKNLRKKIYSEGTNDIKFQNINLLNLQHDDKFLDSISKLISKGINGRPSQETPTKTGGLAEKGAE